MAAEQLRKPKNQPIGRYSDQGVAGRTVVFAQKSCYEFDSSSFTEQVKKRSPNQKG